MEEYSKCRIVPRYTCVGAAEIIHNGSLCWGRLGDISDKGCYIETVYPSPVGEKVQLRLTIAGDVLEIGGTVAWIAPQAGMGVSFVFGTMQEESKLAQILEEVAASGRPTARTGSESVAFTRVAAPEILAKVIKHLNEKGVLTMQDLNNMVNSNR